MRAEKLGEVVRGRRFDGDVLAGHHWKLLQQFIGCRRVSETKLWHQFAAYLVDSEDREKGRNRGDQDSQTTPAQSRGIPAQEGKPNHQRAKRQEAKHQRENVDDGMIARHIRHADHNQ